MSGASRWAASHSVLTRASGRAYGMSDPLLRQRDDEPAVHLALVLDLDALDTADLGGARDVRTATRLQIDAFDRQEPHAALAHRRAHAHGLDQLGSRGQLLVGYPLRHHRMVVGEYLVDLLSHPFLGRHLALEVEVEAALVGVDLAAGDVALDDRRHDMQRGVHAHVLVA